jgi:PilZ domain
MNRIDSESDRVLQAEAPGSSVGKSPRQSANFRVYNRSGESFLSLEVAIFDTTAEPLKRLYDYLLRGGEKGLWLKPYRGVPVIQGANFFDLVYLDQSFRVTHDLDSYPNPEFAKLENEPASALLLPAHTVFASQIRAGDQLAICGSEELEGMLESVSDPWGQDLSSLNADFSGGSRSAGNDLLSSNSGPHRMPPQPILAEPAATESGSEGEGKKSLGVRIWCWLFPKSKSDYRTNRTPLPGLIAYHWSGGTPQAYHVGNISVSGFFLLTDERPYPGTLILMTLQKTGTNAEKPENSIAVYTKVIRWGPDGVGFRFVAVESKDARSNKRGPKNFANQESLDAFLRKVLRTR